MANYYEILKIPSTATAAEVESAYEQQYNRWRWLVTHHDPQVVEEANRALRTLETIRTTLINPEKHSVYDTAIGLRGNAGCGIQHPLSDYHQIQGEPKTL